LRRSITAQPRLGLYSGRRPHEFNRGPRPRPERHPRGAVVLRGNLSRIPRAGLAAAILTALAAPSAVIAAPAASEAAETATIRKVIGDTEAAWNRSDFRR